MAEKQKLSIVVGLEGGKEIQQQLKEIGEAGQKAFLEISKAAEQVGGFSNLKIDDVTKQLVDMGVTGVQQLNAIGKAFDTAVQTEKLQASLRVLETGIGVISHGVVGLVKNFGLVGAAISTAKAAFDGLAGAAEKAREAIAGIEAAAAKAGTGIEKFDQLRQSLEGGGVSAKGIADGIQKLAEAAEKGKIDQVAKDLANLQEISKRGFGALGTPELQRLVDTAQGIGPAAKAAREALDKLGVKLPPGAIESLSDLAARAGTTKEAMAAFIKQLEGIKDPAERNAVAFKQMGEAGLEIARGINTGRISSQQFAQQVATDASTINQAMANAAANIEQSFNRSAAAWERFKTTGDFSQLGTILAEAAARAGNSFAQMGAEWDSFASKVGPAVQASIGQVGGLIAKIGELASSIAGVTWDSISSGAIAAWNAITGAIGGAIEAVGNFASSIANIVWDAISSAGVAAWDAITGAINKAIDAIKQFLGLGGSGQGTGAGGSALPGMAGGGMIGGRGSGTSDSNLALVSRGEHIMPARVVRQPGVLALLEALRRGVDLEKLLGGLGRYSAGGVVGMPALAGGGMGGGANLGTLTLGLPSGGSVTVRASSSVVEELRREAAMAQVRSGGRKPSRYT